MKPTVACRVPVFRPNVTEHMREAVTRCLDSFWIGNGPEAKRLEAVFEERGGWAVATVNCTSALYLAGRLLHPSLKDEVIVPAITFANTATAMLAAGLKVRLVDVDKDSLLVNYEQVAAALNERTRAVVVVHLYGSHFEDSKLYELAKNNGAVVIEDCAHRIDVLDFSPPKADFCCYSFGAVKECPAGEGGLLWGSDQRLEQEARHLSNAGLTVDTLTRSGKAMHLDYGFIESACLKLRISDLNAALARASLEELQDTRRIREKINSRYRSFLERVDSCIRLLPCQGDSSYLMNVIRVDSSLRDRVRSHLGQRGFGTSVHYPPLTSHPLFCGSKCEIAEAAAKELVTLPSYLGLDGSTQRDICDSIGEALEIGPT